MIGTVKTKTDRGFGFISQEGGERDIFFHKTALNGISFEELQTGDRVSYEVASTDRGPSAINVSRADGEASAEPQSEDASSDASESEPQEMVADTTADAGTDEAAEATTDETTQS